MTCFLLVYVYVGEVLNLCLKPSAGTQLHEWNPASTPSQVRDLGGRIQSLHASVSYSVHKGGILVPIRRHCCEGSLS